MSRPSFLNSSIGDYRLVDFLGAGGMGDVYRAVHTKIGRVVAVKVLTGSGADASPEAIPRFFNEARIQAGLNHRNLATLYDFLEVGGQPCIIMEYVDGQTIAERIRSIGALPPSEALFIFQAVSEALAYVHSNSVIHRDIKSNNIKITSTGEVKLLDFGIAKHDSTPNLTVTGGVIGTLQYLSPEQLRGSVADARTDIWAMGVLLYEMATGAVPFGGSTLGELCDKIGKAAYTPPTMANPGVPRELESIISRCLKKNPADRYQTVRDLLADVTRLASTSSTPRLSSVVSTSTPVKKNNRLWMIAAAATGLLIVFVGALFLMSNLMNQDSGSNDPVPAPANRQATNNTANRSTIGGGQSATDTAGMRKVTLDVDEGRAEVFRDGKQIGVTPFQFEAKQGEHVDFILHHDGYVDRPVNLTVNDINRPYTYSLEKKR